MIEVRHQLPGAPEATRFAAAPTSWYLLGRAAEISVRPRAVIVGGERGVAFRTASGRLAVLGARCAHMGADLALGEVVGEAIRCPFHGWEYGTDGACLRIPTALDIPAFARQPRFATAERWGLAFAWSGPDPDEALPLPRADLVPARPLRFVLPFPWYLVASNAFDVQHLRSVHDRELLGAPEVDALSDRARRIRYRVRIRGHATADRLLRLLAGGEVAVSITVHGGTLVEVEARFRRAVSRILFGIAPQGAERAEVAVVPLAPHPRGAAALVQPLLLALRRHFTGAFVAGDLTALAGVRYSPETLIAADRPLVDYYHWAAALPAAGAAPSAATPSLRRISP